MIVRRAKRFAAALAMLSIALAPASALAEEEAKGAERVAAITFDLLILRPLGLIRLHLGSVLLPIVWPFALVNGQKDEIIQRLITEPGEHAVVRKLGDL